MASRVPLPTLLSYLLVAFTIEFDNEAEHSIPHRTTDHGATPGSVHAPWLVSLAMWMNCMQFVSERGLTERALEKAARTKTNLDGMQRWGYVAIGQDRLIRATPSGLKAQELCRPLLGQIENRWRQRFGESEVAQLRDALCGLASRIEYDLPDCLPILGYGLFSRLPNPERRNAAGDASAQPLPSLLGRALLAFAIDFENQSEVSLAICANVLRIIGPEGVRVRDLPRQSGVSKELIAVAVKFLQARGLACVQAEGAGSRVKAVVLTAKGERARDKYLRLLPAVEEDWRVRFGEDVVKALRNSLERLTENADVLFRGMEPYPDGWRTAVPAVLPDYPMVSHRGGFPDGS